MNDQNFKKDLRSVLLSEKDGILIENLNEKFHKLIGKDINYDTSKYSNLESFLLTLTDTLKITKSRDQIVVLAKANENQQNLQDLIKRQKSNKKALPLRRPLNSREISTPNPSKRILYAKRFNTNKSSGARSLNENNTIKSFDESNTSSSESRKENNNCNKKISTENTAQSRFFDVRAQNTAKNSKIQFIETRPSDYKSAFYRKKSPVNKSSNSSSLNNKASNRRRPTPNQNSVKPSSFNFLFKIKYSDGIDYKLQLCNYTKEHNLPEPKFVLSSHIERGKVVAYFSKVQIENKSWLIFPVGYKTQDEADSAVAKKALDELKSKISIKAEIAEKEDDIIDKLLDLFKNNDPIFSHCIENLFLETYSIKLQNDWLDIISKSDKFDVQNLSAGKRKVITVAPSLKSSISNVKLIDTEKNSTANCETEKNSTVDCETEKNSTVDCETEKDLLRKVCDQLSFLNLDNQELPESLELQKDNNDWQVMVLRANNSREVFLRLNNNTDKLDTLIADLQKYYNEEKLGKLVKNVIINKIYAAVFDGAVFRVQAILLEGDQVYCYFLDDGINEKISRSNLCEIENEFMKLPFQAFSVQLDGLEDQSEILIRKFIDDKIKENDDACCLIARPTKYEPMTVRLYDTSNEDQDIDLNQTILDFIKSKIENLPGFYNSIPYPQLPIPYFNEEYENKNNFQFKVSLVANPQHFIVSSLEHFENDSNFMKLNEQIQDFYSIKEEIVDLNETLIYPGLFVCVKEETNGEEKWFRARVEDLTNSSKLTCYLVDVGKIILTDLKNIQPLYSKFLEFPMVAFRASLSNILPVENDWSIDTIIKFKNLVEEKEFKNCKIVEVIFIDGDPFLQLKLINEHNQNISDVLIEENRAKSL